MTQLTRHGSTWFDTVAWSLSLLELCFIQLSLLGPGSHGWAEVELWRIEMSPEMSRAKVGLESSRVTSVLNEEWYNYEYRWKKWWKSEKKGISIANLRYQEHADPVQGHCDICEQRHCNGCVQVTRRCGLCTLNTAMLWRNMKNTLFHHEAGIIHFDCCRIWWNE